jgi:hypothetical protein
LQLGEVFAQIEQVAAAAKAEVELADIVEKHGVRPGADHQPRVLARLGGAAARAHAGVMAQIASEQHVVPTGDDQRRDPHPVVAVAEQE